MCDALVSCAARFPVLKHGFRLKKKKTVFFLVLHYFSFLFSHSRLHQFHLCVFVCVCVFEGRRALFLYLGKASWPSADALPRLVLPCFVLISSFV